jgi:drug/metabolite transporter (DMT)-like permease
LRKYRALVAASVMIPAGTIAIAAVVFWQGDWTAFAHISPSGWLAVLYLTSFGGAITFVLWIWALEHTAPSRVALAVTLNPVSAAVLGALLLGEPVTWRLFVGLSGVVGALALVNWASIRSTLRARDKS